MSEKKQQGVHIVICKGREFQRKVLRQRRRASARFVFYGQPDSIEIWYRDETKVVDFVINIEPRERKG